MVKRELRGILIDYPHEGLRVRLITRDPSGEDYETLVFPPGKPLNRGQIIKFLGDHYNLEPGHIVWPRHLKIPKIKGGK